MITMLPERPEGTLSYSDCSGSGELALVEGAGHYPQTEMPEKTAPIVLELLRWVAS